VSFYDLRSQRIASRPKVKMLRGKPVLRDPAKVRGVTLHQTAAVYGVTARQIKAAGGDRELALARRASKVACHAMAFRSGIVVAATPLLWHVNHANGLNEEDLGLEIEGLYAGLDDDPDTYPRREDLETTAGARAPCMLDERTIAAAREALAWLVSAAALEGMRITHVHAHRQSSPTRRADPGQGLWREVGLWAVRELGLVAEPGRVWQAKRGPGRPIPAAWGGVGSY
jgi:hypothetical protein